MGLTRRARRHGLLVVVAAGALMLAGCNSDTGSETSGTGYGTTSGSSAVSDSGTSGCACESSGYSDSTGYSDSSGYGDSSGSTDYSDSSGYGDSTGYSDSTSDSSSYSNRGGGAGSIDSVLRDSERQMWDSYSNRINSSW